MSKTVELARHLEKLHINNMYKTDFYWTWDKTDDEIDAVFTVADALRDLRERNKSTKIFNSGLGISLFRDNSTRTRFSFASACNFLGLEEQVLDEKKSQIAHGETVRETANMVDVYKRQSLAFWMLCARPSLWMVRSILLIVRLFLLFYCYLGMNRECTWICRNASLFYRRIW